MEIKTKINKLGPKQTSKLLHSKGNYKQGGKKTLRMGDGEGDGTHSSALAWKITGIGEPGGLPSMGSHRVGHD